MIIKAIYIKSRYLSLLLTTVMLCLFINTKAQHQPQLTIVYDITIQKNNNKTGIEETYNGGSKTLFINDKKARTRLTSLMRIQSIFLEFDSTVQKATVIKESGKKKYLFRLTQAQWKLYNKKYDSLICDTSYTDSVNIKGYACRKAVIKTADEKEVIVFYTDSIKLNNSIIEPLFRCIKGTVLQYEIAAKKGTMRFTAAEISTRDIDPKIFAVPSKGAIVRKYSPDKKLPKEKEFTSEEDE